MTDDAPYPRRWTALILLAAAQFVVVLDASIVNVALPSIKAALHFSQLNLFWVVNAYTLTFGGFLLLGGRAADLLGRRRVFMFGMALFAVASLAGGFATSEGWLLAARAAQGLGAAIISPAALSIVANLFKEGSERNKALGIWGAVAGAGGAVGVLLGGMLTTWLSWRWVLFVNVPVAVVAISLSPGLLPESRADQRRHIDVLGAVSVTAGLVVLVYGMVKTDVYGWGSARTIGTLALAAALLVAFVIIELAQRDPLIRLGIYRNRNVATANIIGFLNGVCLTSMFFFTSLYLQQVLGYSALTTGVCWVPLCIVIIVTAGSVGQLVTRIGVKPVTVSGLISMCLGLYLFGHVDAHGSFGSDVLLPSLLAAFGVGCVFVTVTIIAVSGVAMKETGLASGLLTTAQQVGAALGVAILSTIANATTTSALDAARSLHARPDVSAALAAGFRDAFMVGAGFAAAGVIVALVMIRDVRVPAGGEPIPAGAVPNRRDRVARPTG